MPRAKAALPQLSARLAQAQSDAQFVQILKQEAEVRVCYLFIGGKALDEFVPCSMAALPQLSARLAQTQYDTQAVQISKQEAKVRVP